MNKSATGKINHFEESNYFNLKKNINLMYFDSSPHCGDVSVKDHYHLNVIPVAKISRSFYLFLGS